MRLLLIGSASVQDGAHAWQLANQIKDIVDSRKLKEKRGTLHIFSRCPNALVFLLGRYSLSFRKTVLYDYDFMKQRDVHIIQLSRFLKEIRLTCC